MEDRTKPRAIPHQPESISDELAEQLKDDKWRDFYKLDAVKARLRLKEEFLLKQRRDRYNASHPVDTLPPIDYIKREIVVSGDPSVRLLQRVDIRRESDYDDPDHERKRIMVDPLPGKCNFKSSKSSGESKFGILNMSWTTGTKNKRSPVAAGANTNLAVNMGDGSVRKRPDVTHFASLGDEELRQQFLFRPTTLPPIDGYYSWDEPLPPAPYRMTCLDEPVVYKQQKHYCDYYKLIKAGMQHNLSPRMQQTMVAHVNELRHEHFSDRHYPLQFIDRHCGNLADATHARKPFRLPTFGASVKPMKSQPYLGTDTTINRPVKLRPLAVRNNYYENKRVFKCVDVLTTDGGDKRSGSAPDVDASLCQPNVSSRSLDGCIADRLTFRTLISET